MDTTTTTTPALDSIQKARDEGSEVIGAFLEWLQTQGLDICSPDDWGDMQPERLTSEQMLARYFNIDLDAAEREREALLASLRAAHS